MAGLRPGHPRLSCLSLAEDVDARHKAGHDDSSSLAHIPAGLHLGLVVETRGVAATAEPLRRDEGIKRPMTQQDYRPQQPNASPSSSNLPGCPDLPICDDLSRKVEAVRAPN